jgi:lysophospholipase L1-like esterase
MVISMYEDSMTSCFRDILIALMLFSGSASMAAEIQTPSRWIGVVDQQNHAFGWPGSGFSLAFYGTSLEVTLKDGGQNSVIVADGKTAVRLNLKPGTHVYELAAHLPPGPHTFNVMRRTEGLFGDTDLISARTDGTFMTAAEPERRLLIIGDSISAGYGLEGADAHCQFSADTENHSLTYGAIAGRDNQAEVTTLAISGIGVSRNNNGQTAPTMPQRMQQPTPNRDQIAQEPLRAPPAYQAIVINLGTNDFASGNRPAGFLGDYTALLQKLRQVQPTARIYAALGPMLADADFHAAEQAIQQAVALRQADGDSALRYLRLRNDKTGGTGCDNHPNRAAHAALADILNQALKHDLGWNGP